MKSKSKNLEVAKRTEDKLSTLPESVLYHIFSFLPTKHAAATSILSTSWRYTFLSIPTIDLDDSLILNPENQERNNVESFLNFVNRLFMLLKTPSVSKFRLKCGNLVKTSIITAWITAAIRYNVEVLDIWVQNLADFESLRSQVFMCKTLVVLKLQGNFFLEFPKSVCWSNLKVLHLEYVEILLPNDNPTLRFSDGLPLLEDLRMNKINTSPRFPGLIISIPLLSNLALIGLSCFPWIFIDTPNLQNLEYYDIAPPNLLCNLPYVVKADLSIISPGVFMIRTISYKHLATIIKQLYNVKFLRLFGGSLEVLFYADLPLPKYNNLTHLELGADLNYQWKLLETLLECAPNLEMLDFDMGNIDNPPSDYHPQRGLDYHELDRLPFRLAQNLKDIKIRNFCGHECDFELVRYFLQHGAVLVRMTLGASRYGKFIEWPIEVCKKLLMFSRCSKDCKIKLK